MGGGVGCWGADGADKGAGIAAFSSGKQQGVSFTARPSSGLLLHDAGPLYGENCPQRGRKCSLSSEVDRKVMRVVCLACSCGHPNNELDDPGAGEQWSDPR